MVNAAIPDLIDLGGIELSEALLARSMAMDGGDEAIRRLGVIERWCRARLTEAHPAAASGGIPKQFEVYDHEVERCCVFDATDLQNWGPVHESEGWNMYEGFPEYNLELTLYRHRSGHWTLLCEKSHWEAGNLGPPEARRMDDAEAADWLVRHGFEPPPDIASLAADSFFDPASPNGSSGKTSPPVGMQDSWYLFYRDAAARHTGEEAGSGCAAPHEWRLFSTIEDLTPAEVDSLKAAMEAEFHGPVGDDGKASRPLYEFHARQGAELIQNLVDFARTCRAWDNLRKDYTVSDFVEPDGTEWRLHSTAHELAEAIRGIREVAGGIPPVAPGSDGSASQPRALNEAPGTPYWDADRRELRFDGALCKRYRQKAGNQELVLNVFQECEWPPRLDDPLPQRKDSDPRQRLADTVRALNRNSAIQFELDGTGEGILWSPKKAP